MNQLHILIIDDDAELALIMAKSLLFEGYSAISANSIELAEELCRQQTYDLIISDVHFKQAQKIDSIGFMKSHVSKTKFILMTGHSNLMDLNQAKELGAVGFLQKPFLTDDLLAAIKNTICADLKLDEYYPISIDDVKPHTQLNFDVYLKLSNQKVLKIFKKEDSLESQRLQSYKDRGAKKFLIKKEDTSHLFALGNIQFDVPLSEKQDFITNSPAPLKGIQMDGISRDIIDQTKIVFDNAFSIATADRRLLRLLIHLKLKSQSLFQKSLSTSMLSTIIAENTGWDSASSQFHISSAGIFHATENFFFQNNPLPEEVLKIVRFHDKENNDPLFSDNLKKDDSYFLSRILSVAKYFCTKSMEYEEQTQEQYKNILNEMHAQNGERFEPHALAGLMNVFSYPIPESVLKDLTVNR